MGWDQSQEASRAQSWQGTARRRFGASSLCEALSPSAPGRQLSSTATRDPVLGPVHLIWRQGHPTLPRPGVASSEPRTQRSECCPHPGPRPPRTRICSTPVCERAAPPALAPRVPPRTVGQHAQKQSCRGAPADRYSPGSKSGTAAWYWGPTRMPPPPAGKQSTAVSAGAGAGRARGRLPPTVLLVAGRARAAFLPGVAAAVPVGSRRRQTFILAIIGGGGGRGGGGGGGRGGGGAGRGGG